MTFWRGRRNLFGVAAACLCALLPASCMAMRGGAAPAQKPAAVASKSSAGGGAAATSPKPETREKPAAPTATAKADKAKPPEAAAASGALELTVSQAVLVAVENNRQLSVERLVPQITRTAEGAERGVFDPVLAGKFGYYRELGMDLNSSGDPFDFIQNTLVGNIGVKEFLPTGTTIGLGLDTRPVDEADVRARPTRNQPTVFRQLVQTRAGLTVTQALLRGAGTEVNLARIREARLNTLASDYELRGFSEAVVARVETAYWDLVLAAWQVEILEQGISMAEGQVTQIKERVAGGTLPGMDLTAAEAEIALRREELVDVRSDMAKTRVRLLRLMNPPGDDVWRRDVKVVDKAAPSDVVLDDVESHVQVALKMRPDLNQARLAIQRGDLEVVRTANGLLPKLDLFITLGQSGYAETFGGSWGNISGSRHDVLVGMSAEFPIGQHTDRANHDRAVLNRRYADEAVKNMEQLVQEDVRTAYLEVVRTREKAAAIAATRRLDEAKLRVEMEKAMMAKSTAFEVAQAQRDLIKDRLGEADAIVGQMKAAVNLYRLEGSLLERRGIGAPGGNPPATGSAGR